MTNEEFIQSIALPGEEWRNVVGSDGRYVISSFGRIAALSFPYMQGEYLCYRKQRIKSQKVSSHGYLSANVILNGKPRLYSIHRMVAEAFLPNPNKMPCVNHKDENKQNNHVSNLEWCTHEYNMNYGVQSKMRSLHSLKPLGVRKPVVQLTLEGGYVATHRSVYYASKTVGVQRDSLRQCLKKKRRSTGGYIWLYASDYESQVSMSKNSMSNPD